MFERIRQEPVAFQALLQTLIALGISFGLKLTVEQVGCILAATAAVLAFFTRRAVTPNAKNGNGSGGGGMRGIQDSRLVGPYSSR